MPKVSPIQTNFNSGEFSPLMFGRVDYSKYKNALATCFNSLPLVQGAVTRRPGFYFVAEVKDSTKATRVVRFEFSTTQAYIIEVGDLYMRFYRDNGRIESGGSPVEIVTPYTAAQVFELKFTQSADVLYIAHPSHRPRKLSRTSHTAWTLSTIDFRDGPYLTTNSTATTLTLGGITGSVTVTASVTTGINSNAGFSTADVGRLIRWKDPAGNWTWLEITAWTSTTQVTATIRGSDASATTATVNWRLGVWSTTTGFPAATTFFEDRLCWGGCPGSPQRIDMSRTGDYEGMSPSDRDGTVTADAGVGITLNSNDVQVIRWMQDDEKGLLVGTVKGEWIVRPSTQSEALSPTNVNAKQSTTHGSANIQAIRAAKGLLYVQRSARKLRELAYVYEVDGFRSPDMTVLAQHVTKSGIKEIAYQQEPQSIVWCVLNNGKMAGFTYERDQDVIGWHRHEIASANSSINGSSPGFVESVATIPAVSGDHDELWVVTKRSIGGSLKRFIEYMAPIYENGDDQKGAYFVDCGLSFDGSDGASGGMSRLTVTSTTTTADDAIFTTADVGKRIIKGDTTTAPQDDVIVEITGYVSPTQVNSTVIVDGILSPPFVVASGLWHLEIGSVTGLTHLEGEVVSVVTDGTTHPDKTVSGGSIALDGWHTVVHVGYAYNSDGQTMRFEAGAADGTAQGKKQRTHRVIFRFLDSLNIKVGRDFDHLDRLIFRKTTDPLGEATPLFTGDMEAPWEGEYTTDNRVCWRWDQPLPGTILSIMPQLHTQDR